MSHIKTLVLIVSTLVSSVALAGAFDELTPAQQAAVQKGEQVMVTQNVSSSDFPKVFIFQRIDGTPDEAMAVYMDYELQKSYVPDLPKSTISKRIDSRTTEVDFKIDVPMPMPDEDYTIRFKLSSASSDAYRLDWKLVRADTTKDTVGHTRFEKLGTATFMYYYNFVTPGRFGASAGKSMAVKQMQLAINAFIKQVQKERTANPALLQKQQAALKAALN